MPKEEKSFQFKIKVREFLISLEEYLYYLIALGLIIGFILVMIDGIILLMGLSYEKENISIKFLDKVLLALIFLEIFYTVLVALLEDSMLKCVEPFILVAITALIRRLLILSFEISHITIFEAERMKYFLIELTLVGFLVILFIFSLILFRRTKKENGKGR